MLGIDMSEAYIAEARRHLQRRGWSRFLVGKGEAIPVAGESQDAAASIFVFHELPPDIRRAFFREFARVLKPGGRLVIVDSVQLGDEPDSRRVSMSPITAAISKRILARLRVRAVSSTKQPQAAKALVNYLGGLAGTQDFAPVYGSRHGPL